MGIENFITFIFTAFIFVITPGIDTVFVLNKSISQGKKSGIHAALGINSGVLAHTLFAALGLSVLISKSDYAFTIIKYSGAVYLLYMGISSLINNKSLITSESNKNLQTKRKSDFWSGFITNLLNPKVALFFLALFPQFINPNDLENPIPFILLGITFSAIGIIWYLSLTLFAGLFSQKFQENPKAGLWLNKISGCIFILMGLMIALT
ncbi:LysE family translocator [Winogradskyella undariae]|uniref:LysE family translocator n=1 Tax=Winogradskyella undariae TaxID=1285465 RepID=UPI00156B5A6D|nr:LysE family translocator [Winogradskyella undariae]NRR91804.1 LysE family translocator [Winogradskyella undariae]